MTRDDVLQQAETMIDREWRKAIAALEVDMRSQGFTEEGVAAMLEIRRQDWAQAKSEQLLEISEWLRGRLH
jgi:hypothetical protein